MLISFNSICVKYQRFSLLSQIQMISFRLDALKFENLYKKLLPTISTFSYVSGQTKQVCPTVQPIRHTRHDCSFTIRAWTDISKTDLKRSNLNYISTRHWYQSLLHLSNYIILTYLSDCKRFQLKLVPIFMWFYRWFKKKKRSWDKSPSLSIIFGLSSKTQWLSGLYYADFTSFYSPTQLCGGGTTKSNSNELPISVPLSSMQTNYFHIKQSKWYRFCPTPYFDFAFYGLCILVIEHALNAVWKR